MIFVGMLESLNARQRRQGVIDEVFGRPELKDVVDFQMDDPNKEQTVGKYRLWAKTYLDQPEGAKKAKENAEEAIKDMPKSGNVCMVGLWAYNPPMILSAVKDKLKDRPDDRKRVKIVGFDEDKTTLQGIRDGEIHATVVQDPYNFGYESVKMLAALAKGDRSVLPANGLRYIPHRVIGPKGEEKNGLKRISVDVFEPELKKLLGQ
jgi:ribose transport system substrate-binding protein